MTNKQIIEVVTAAEAGKKIQFRRDGIGSWTNRSNSRDPEWNFTTYEYRVAPEPREISKGAEMPPEAQRIAIAEACGWTDTHCTAGLPCGIGPNEKEHREVPNYFNDLNAMHEAEEMLTVEQRNDCAAKLAKWLKDNSPHGSYFFVDFDLMHATAAQRAEAFLKTIGKWVEE